MSRSYDFTSGSSNFVASLKPTRQERNLAVATLVVSALTFLLLAPFAKVQLPEVWAFIPVYQTAIAMNDFITAGLLFGQFAYLRRVALLLLAGGYLVCGLTAIVHMISFPGAFAPRGLIGGGQQTTAWLYIFWHASFPIAILLYTRLKQGRPLPKNGRIDDVLPIAACIFGAFFLAIGFTLIATLGHDLLPPIMRANSYTDKMPTVITALWVFNILSLAYLWRRQPHSVLDLWLVVVAIVWIFDIALSAVLNHGRFDLGFYAGRIYGLLASGFVLCVLMFENGRLYSRIVRALEGERTEHKLVIEKSAELNEANAELERRVEIRTRQLSHANAELRQEIEVRRNAELALENSQAELREISKLSADAREDEKRRIARELHDELAQSLATLRMDLDWFSSQRQALEPELRSRVRKSLTLMDSAIASTRRIAAELRPLMLDDLGFAAAIGWLVDSISDRFCLDCRLTCKPVALELAEPFATAAFRIVQEGLANVARHAKATIVEIEIVVEGDNLDISIFDNGVGFNIASRRKPTSFGLVGMRERAYLVGGTLSIETAAGHGTRIRVRIPMAHSAEAQRNVS